ncbi:hypothetical protein ABZ863_01770 [Saccharomonospora sp. NPDC046836]|uniref:hypothetical protein n=1 Tax=Saccharomonospora sp. NPDC046836 TaxID=3156921 RepID=UPI0033DE7938
MTVAEVDMIELSTRDDAVARAERIRSGIRSLVELQQDITDAYHARDWQALGYDTWESYVAGEFGNSLPKLARDERRELVVSLRAEGLSTRAIASAVGSNRETVRQAIAADKKLPPAAEAEAEPAPVTGLDGKTYSSKPRVTDLISADDLAELNGTPKAETPVDADVVEEPEPASEPRQRRERVDVVKVMNQVLVHAEDAAERAAQIRKTHLSNRSEEAAVWGRRLAQALDSLQGLNTSLQEASS